MKSVKGAVPVHRVRLQVQAVLFQVQTIRPAMQIRVERSKVGVVSAAEAGDVGRRRSLVATGGRSSSAFNA